MSTLLSEKRSQKSTSSSIGQRKTETLTSSTDPKTDVSEDLGEYRLVGHAIVEGRSLPPIIEQLKDKRMRIDICSSKVKLSKSRKVHGKTKHRKKKKIGTRRPEQKSRKSEFDKSSSQKLTTSLKFVERKSSGKKPSQKIIKNQQAKAHIEISSPEEVGYDKDKIRKKNVPNTQTSESKSKTSSKKKKRNKSTSKSSPVAKAPHNKEKKGEEKPNEQSQKVPSRASKRSQAVQNSDVLAVAGIRTPVAYFKRVVSDEQSSPVPKAQRSMATPKRCGCFGGQVYEELRKLCKREKILFEDPFFPAQDSSLSINELPYEIQWLRPSEICDKPQLLVGGHSRFDVKQGELGDCWLLAAMANLTMHDELFYRVVPQDQSFSDDYAGIFHFRIWQYGRWIDVVVDDRLPTKDGRLMYLHSEDSDEFWSTLLEKAYAKLSGSYERLKGGSTMEAAQDFTGGVTEYLDIKTRPKRFRRLMFMGFRLGSILACSMMPNPSITEQRLENGLIRGHAYSVTGITVVNYNGKQLALVRVRNPWGDENEWQGAWSDKSPEWKTLGRNQKNSLSLQFASDGEFWMNYYDFVKHFDKLDMCHLGPDNAQETTAASDSKTDMTTWQTAKHVNEWVANKSAGGCRNFADSYVTNPQYLLTLQDSDAEDDDPLCTCIVALMQMYRRENKDKGVQLLSIGFCVYEADQKSESKITAENLRYCKEVARSNSFINLREVSGRFRLQPGSYIVVPSTFNPNEESHFLLRVFANGPVEMKLL